VWERQVLQRFFEFAFYGLGASSLNPPHGGVLCIANHRRAKYNSWLARLDSGFIALVRDEGRQFCRPSATYT